MNGLLYMRPNTWSSCGPGDIHGYNGPYFKRRFALGSLAIAECAEDKGRFLDDIMNGIWCICEESSWSPPANNITTVNYWEPEYFPLPDITGPAAA